ncbi:MAG TPA: hypothetical protein PLB89_14520 [Flavobacteriales bacterium]|nr:hypothetical protein [Flavobacteriales bacterium]
MALFFARRKVIRFTSEEDILEYGRFVLPESLDPSYDQRSTPLAKRNEPTRPLWFNVRLDEFAARIVRPDGTWGEVGAFASVDRNQVATLRNYATAWTYVLDLQAIAPGDVVEVVWKYMVPYDVNAEHTAGWRGWEWMDNWARLTSWRVFFHGELPIRHQRMSVRYRLQHGLAIGGGSFYSIEENGDERTAIWDQRDLPACMDEVNARPGVDLPHIRLTLQIDDLRYWMRDRLSGMPIHQSYWLNVLRTREARAQWWQRVARKGVPDRQNALLQEFMDRTLLGIPEVATARRIEALHEYIAERFTYKNDTLWFQNVDKGTARIGDQVSHERIREISRFDLYAKMIYALGADFSTAYLLDKRIGRMDDQWMTHLWDNDLLFGVKDMDRTLWMHPKRGPTGLWAGELPFFWQGSNAVVMKTAFQDADRPLSPLFIDLPSDDAAANVRVVETRIDVAANSSGISGTSQVLLCGQFSTLGRGAYQGLPMDATVHPFYGDVLQRSELNGGEWQIRTNSSDLPFRFQAERSFVMDELLVQGEKGAWAIDLSRMIGHAVPADFVAQGRDLPFHWDFAQNDRSIIDLHFDRPMEFEAVSGLEAVAVTPNARVERSVSIEDRTHVRIESRLVVTGEREAVKDAVALEHLLRVAGASDLVLRGRPVNGQP